VSAGNNSTLLEVRDLKKYFPVRGGLFQRVVAQVRAVDGVNFSIAKGHTFGLVGESGCGKSTLGRAILRLQEPTSGQVFVDGQDILGLRRSELGAQRRRMQIIFQDPFASLSPRRTVAQIIREPLDVHRIGTAADRESRIIELLSDVGMGAEVRDRYPHEFSGGQRQRIGIARALALDPDFIVADEPVSALDVSVQSQVLNLIAELKKDEIGVMYLGRIVEQATVGALYAEPKHPYTQALMSAIPVPDPTAKQSRIVLEGDVPSPMNPPAGCPFHTRCAQVMAVCKTVVPPNINVGSENNPHQVSCHLHS